MNRRQQFCGRHFDGTIDQRNKNPDPICAIASTEKVKCACRKAKFYGKMLLAKQNHLHEI